MLKKYLQIIIFSILCLSGVTHDASGEGKQMPNCCERCKDNSQYFSCLGVECKEDAEKWNIPPAVCPTNGIETSTEGCCGKCIQEHARDGKVNFESGSSYAQCIKKCKKMCPDKDTPENVYQHLLIQNKS